MSTLIALVAALFGGLCWAGRRRRYSYGPDITNNYTDVYCDSDGAYDDADTFCSPDNDDRDDADYWSSDYSGDSSGSDNRDD